MGTEYELVGWEECDFSFACRRRGRVYGEHMRRRVGSCFLRVGIELHVELRGEARARERSVDGTKRREHANQGHHQSMIKPWSIER